MVGFFRKSELASTKSKSMTFGRTAKPAPKLVRWVQRQTVRSTVVLGLTCWYNQLIINISTVIIITTIIRGHPFMTSTRRGTGVMLRWTHVDGGGGSSPMWTSTQKIKIRVH